VSPRVRLALFVGGLTTAFVLVTVTGVVTEEGLRERLDPLGWGAPFAYVAVAVVLGLLLVPGALLATVSGLLFGAAVGTVVTLSAAVINAVLALLIARRAGRPGVEEIGGERVQRLTALFERHGLVAVIVQRLAPGVPDGPMSYAAGLAGIRTWQIALGTLLGGAPRAFSYTSIGAALDEPGSPLGWAGVAGLVVTALAGAWLARRLLGAVRR